MAKVEVVYPAEPEFQLTLSKYEATVLLNILFRGVGGPSEGPRGVSDQIVRVLDAVGIEEDSAIKMCNVVALYEGD